MPSVSAVFLVLALALSVLFGAQTNSWSWGPALISLTLATIPALVVLIKQPTRMLNTPMLILGGLTIVWFGMRAIQSPVTELGHADLLLLSSTWGGFISLLAIQRCRRASWILTGGIAALLLLNLIVMLAQLKEPSYSLLVYRPADSKFITGLFTHYNYAANYLLVSSIWLLAQAWHARKRWLQVGLGLLGATGMIAIYWTNSRGGLLAAIIALACFGLIILIDARRNKAKWFPAAAIALPFAALILIGLLISGWQNIQTERSHDGSGEISDVLDNSARLNYLGLAASSIAEHPLTGGGSQSFSWESYQHWDRESLGWHTTKPGFAHNEWMQAATDYGLVGFLLVLGLMTVTGISAILRLSFEQQNSGHSHKDAWRLAGFAGLVGMLTHANFSFIFHLMPGALMLGMCLAASVQWHAKVQPKPGILNLQRALIAFIGLMVLLATAPLSWKGARVMTTLWPSHYGKDRELRAAEKIDALDRAIAIWPQAALYMNRGYTRHALALSSTEPVQQASLMEKALEDYTAAQKLHPFLPEAAINRASLLSMLDRNDEARSQFEDAIRLQGGMEPAFLAHRLYASHLLQLGKRELETQNRETALKLIEKAAGQIELSNFTDGEGRRLSIEIYETLGFAFELNGMFKPAFENYSYAAGLYGRGHHVHLRIALLQAAKANEHLAAREPSKALALYLEAKVSVSKSGGRLPENITPEQRQEFVTMLDASIKQLREIGIEPAK